MVIVGGGFGGLEAARKLKGAPVDVTVLDRYNHHLFQPLLYQVATAVLSPGDISAPIRQVLRGPNITVLLAEARSIDVERKVLVTDGGEIPYDTLVLATGATHSYFGHPEWARFAPGLKTIDDARDIRERVLLALEAAEREPDPERQREWLTFVIIGAGPTGVELAGALAFMTRHSLPKDFRRIDTSQARVLLLEGLSRVLNVYPEGSRSGRVGTWRRPAWRSAPAPWSPTWTTRASPWATPASGRARCSGARAWRPLPWRGRSACRSTRRAG